MNILDEIKRIKNNSINSYIELERNGDLIKYNQREIIKKINCYINNKYYNGNDENRIFWNLSNHRITHFAKQISPDTKDFYPYGEGELNIFQSWVLKKKVKKFFKDEKYYEFFNDSTEKLATYGSLIWKKYKENGKPKIKIVNLLNIYFDQSIENIQDADGIVEIHYLNKKQLYDYKDIWNNVDELLEENKDNYEIWEYSGYFSEDDNVKYQKIIGYTKDNNNYIELWREDLEECPYEDFHITSYRGRWLRIGIVERLFDLQARINQLVNQNAQATEIASLLLLKSGNPEMIGNVLEQALNGQIIPDETLQQINLSNIGINSFISELQLIEQQADKLCLTPDIVQGESTPATTTFRGQALINVNIISAFRDLKQNFLEKIANILIDFVFPVIIKDWNKEEILEMAEDEVDIDMFDNILQKKAELNTLLSGIVIDDNIRNEILNQVENEILNNGRKIKIPKNFFNFKWGFKMMPTNETVDKSAQNDAYYNALQWVLANPSIVDIPLFKQYCEDNNIKYWKLTAKQKNDLIMSQNTNVKLEKPKEPDKLMEQATNPQ